jgi:hypothetical protein
MVWLEVAASLVWFGPAALLDALVGWWSCTSGIFLKTGCSGPSLMVGRLWVDIWLSGGFL